MAKRIYVGNLPWSYASSDLEALFREYGEVAAAEVIMDRETGRSRGFGFVQMANDGDMDAAVEVAAMAAVAVAAAADMVVEVEEVVMAAVVAADTATATAARDGTKR